MTQTATFQNLLARFLLSWARRRSVVASALGHSFPVGQGNCPRSDARSLFCGEVVGVSLTGLRNPLAISQPGDLVGWVLVRRSPREWVTA